MIKHSPRLTEALAGGRKPSVQFADKNVHEVNINQLSKETVKKGADYTNYRSKDTSNYDSKNSRSRYNSKEHA